jgi:hypothetical protein
MKLFDFGLRAALAGAILGWLAQVAGLWPGLFIAPWWTPLAVLAAIGLVLFTLAIFDVRQGKTRCRGWRSTTNTASYDAQGRRHKVKPRNVKELFG